MNKTHRLPFSNLAHLDWVLFVVVVILSIIGLVFSYSSQILIYEGKINPYNNYIKQTFYFFLGIAIMLAISFTNYRKLCSHVYLIYGLAVFLLLYTLISGTIVNQSKRWISIGVVSVQPSEFVKIAIILLVASVLEKIKDRGDYLVNVLSLIAMVGLPFLLIVLQPDLGTALILIPIFLMMISMLGVNAKVFVGLTTATFFFLICVFFLVKGKNIEDPSPFLSLVSSLRNISLFSMVFGAIAMGVFAVNLSFKNPFLQMLGLILITACVGMVTAMFVEDILLKPYQKERLLAFLDPVAHKKDLGYNVLQSQIAIGSGGFLGKGLFNGVQGQLGFLPSRTNDFIFSVVGEELGFLGSLTIMALFLLLLYRIARIGMQAKDYLGGIIVMGVFAMLAFQILTNIAMTVGLMPVTGIPLPFLSTGGSTLWTCLMGVGLVLSVNARRHVNY